MTASMLLAAGLMAARRRRAASLLPAGARLLYRPSQLGLSPGDPVTAFADEGSEGWGLVPYVATPTFEVISGIPCVAYSVGARADVCAVLWSSSHPAVPLTEATGLFIVNLIGASPSSPYAAGTGVSGTSFRCDCARAFAYRGVLLNHVSPISVDGLWHYIVVHYNGANSRTIKDGVSSPVGNVGGSVSISRYGIGAFANSAANRWPGYVADVGIWDGDRTVEVEAYARAVLGLP